MDIQHYNPCPYGTYQRATSRYFLGELTPARIVRLIRAKFTKKIRRKREYRRERHQVYRGAIQHWRNDLETMRAFRL